MTPPRTPEEEAAEQYPDSETEVTDHEFVTAVRETHYAERAAFLAGYAYAKAKTENGRLAALVADVRKIRADLADFDGDRRGHRHALDEAEKALMEYLLAAQAKDGEA